MLSLLLTEHARSRGSQQTYTNLKAISIDPHIGIIAEVEITGGHQPVSVQIVKATKQMRVGLDKMSASLYFT